MSVFYSPIIYDGAGVLKVYDGRGSLAICEGAGVLWLFVCGSLVIW